MRKTSGCVLFIYLVYFNYIAMIKKSPIALAALVLALGTVSISVLPSSAQAQTAEEKEQKKKSFVQNGQSRIRKFRNY